ncbi:MAG: hypothetical protein GX853_02040 [Chloroflexi bacterium]|nr:hypothetical protein [Chloroflexota bacterium]
MKKEKIVKVLSVILALMMVFSLSPMIVFADDLPGELNRGDRKEGLFTKGEEPGVGELGGDEAALYDTVQMKSLTKRSAIGSIIDYSQNPGFYFWEDIRKPDASRFLINTDKKISGGGFLKSQSEGHTLHLLSFDFTYYHFDTRSNTLEEVKHYEIDGKGVVDMTPIMTSQGGFFVGIGFDYGQFRDFLFTFSPQDDSIVVNEFLPQTSSFVAIAYVPKENLLYLVDGENDKLFAMAPGSNTLLEIGDLVYAASGRYFQSMDFDEKNDTLIWASTSENERKLWTIDRKTGKADFVGYLGSAKHVLMFVLIPPEPIHFPMVIKPSAILNGDFENGNAGWKEETEDGSPLIIPDWQVFGAPKAHSGEKYLLFSNETEGIQSVSQTITLPHNADLLTYWDYVYAVGEPTTPEKITIYINGEVLFTGGLHNTLEWNLIDHLSLADYAGQTVEFKVEFISDGSRTIFFFLDDFVVTTRDD